MKQKHNAGFSLVEVLVAIVILGIFVVPTCSSMVMAVQMNAKADEMLKAQLAVSSAVEQLKAEGIDDLTGLGNSIDGVTINATKPAGDSTLPYYNVTVTSNDVASIAVTTVIRDTTKTGGGTP